MPPSAADLLADFAGVARGAGVRWFLFGAQAVVIYGEPRMTADVDVTVEIDPARTPGFAEAMAAAGFVSRVADLNAFAARTHVLPMLHTATGMQMDVILAGTGFEARFLDRAIVHDLGGVNVPVISAEDLIITKLLAGRTKDVDDIRGILRRQSGHLDVVYLRQSAAQLDQALARSDIGALLENLLAGTGQD
jgi:hypothetical protein